VTLKLYVKISIVLNFYLDFAKALVEIWNPSNFSGLNDSVRGPPDQNQVLHDSNEEIFPTVSANYFASSHLGNNGESAPT
jgi:hypothetical protein